MTDNFGDRMKFYEGIETNRVLMPILPIVARMDGICFHSFCADLQRPYEQNLSFLMIEVAEYLLKMFGANCAYTQSDEISLGWNVDSYYTEMFCGGKIQKLNSHLASKTSVRFNKLLGKYGLGHKEDACFDARIWNVPNIVEAANVFLWREQDATRNSVQMAGQAYFSHNQLQNKNNSEIQEMLFSKIGINWNDYPSFFKRGTFIVKKRLAKKFRAVEDLPPNHAARKNPDLMVERVVYHKYDNMLPFTKVANRDRVLFFGEDPIEFTPTVLN